MNTQKSYGVTKQNHPASALELTLENLRIKGYSILENVLSNDTLELAKKKCDEVYLHQQKEFGSENLELIKEKNIARCPLAYDDFFLYHIAANQTVLNVIEKILGSYFILHLQNAIINKPNEEHHQSSWHRDLPYQNFVISTPLAIGALFCIDEFTVQTGCTNVIAFSHREVQLPSAEYIERNREPVIADAGSVILFDAMLFHQAGYNSSQIIRRGINNVYTTPILKQQINLPYFLGNKYINNPFLSKFLGYESNVPDSDAQWRNNRMNKLNK